MEIFDRMKDSAIFINCGRGNAVASDVLYQVLHDRKIAAAGIDVTEFEPLPSDSPLWELENLMITPHISGGHHLPETFERIVEICAQNLSAYLSGKELRNVVDFATGYKNKACSILPPPGRFLDLGEAFLAFCNLSARRLRTDN